MFHPIGGKIAAKSRGDVVARGFIIDVEWVAVERRDLRFARSPRGFGLGVDDPFDRGKHVLAHAGIEGAHIELNGKRELNCTFPGAVASTRLGCATGRASGEDERGVV